MISNIFLRENVRKKRKFLYATFVVYYTTFVVIYHYICSILYYICSILYYICGFLRIPYTDKGSVSVFFNVYYEVIDYIYTKYT